jgi:type III restriction enzyme
MPSKTIDQLIINSPYSEPVEYWRYDRESRLFSRVPGRRDAGYVRACSSVNVQFEIVLIVWPLLNHRLAESTESEDFLRASIWDGPIATKRCSGQLCRYATPR